MKVIIISAVLYLIWIVLYLSWSYRKNKKLTSSITIVKTPKSENIMGKTRGVYCQIQPNNANESHVENTNNKPITFVKPNEKKYSQVVGDEELDSVFENNKMDIDFDYESTEDEIKQESLSCFDGYEYLPSEVGIEYDEMENLAKVVANKEVRPEKVEEASATAYKAKDTELLDAVISGYENGLQKVAAMLAKHEAIQQVIIPKMEHFEDFELTNFL